MASSPKRILVIRGGAIGDFVLTLPVLEALRRRFPDSHLAVLGYSRMGDLAMAGGLADEVRPIESRGLAVFFSLGAKLPNDWRDFFCGFDLIVSYLYDPDGVFRNNVAACSWARFVAGPHRPDLEGGTHATEALLKPLERLGILAADPVPRLRFAGAPPDGARERRLAAHPGSGSEKKNWPESHWADLLKQLAGQSRLQLLLLGGEAESGRLKRLAALWPADRLELACSLPLVELARKLDGCDGFIGHDSGITHLAAALGLRGVALWGETDQQVWRPQGGAIRVLREPGGLSALSVGRVLGEVLDFLPAPEHP